MFEALELVDDDSELGGERYEEGAEFKEKVVPQFAGKVVAGDGPDEDGGCGGGCRGGDHCLGGGPLEALEDHGSLFFWVFLFVS